MKRTSILLVLILLFSLAVSSFSVSSYASDWICPNCGFSASGNFCSECGSKKPAVSSNSWVCVCGGVNRENFCSECGAKKPTDYIPRDYLAEARAQSIDMPSSFSAFTDPQNTFTFYTTDYDNAINMKSRPEDGLKDVLGKVTLPFNGTLVGTCGSWYLVEKSRQYFYIYAPIVGRLPILDTAAPNDFSAILDLARVQGILIPDGFAISGAKSAQMRNSLNTETYAIYKFSSPFQTEKADRMGNFYFRCDINPNTFDYSGWVTCYGYYNNKGLFFGDGGFFWGTSTFFNP